MAVGADAKECHCERERGVNKPESLLLFGWAPHLKR